MRSITLEELSQHKTVKDCWISVHGVVLDITKFLNEHPGGPDIVVSVSGKDCSHDFEDVGHTDSARRMAQPYIIGVLEGYETIYSNQQQPLHIPSNAEVQKMNESKKSGNTSAVSTLFGAAATVVGLAAVYYAFVVHK